MQLIQKLFLSPIDIEQVIFSEYISEGKIVCKISIQRKNQFRYETIRFFPKNHLLSLDFLPFDSLPNISILNIKSRWIKSYEFLEQIAFNIEELYLKDINHLFQFPIKFSNLKKLGISIDALKMLNYFPNSFPKLEEFTLLSNSLQTLKNFPREVQDLKILSINSN